MKVGGVGGNKRKRDANHCLKGTTTPYIWNKYVVLDYLYVVWYYRFCSTKNWGKLYYFYYYWLTTCKKNQTRRTVGLW